MVLPQMKMKQLNKKLSIINRVVVHPKYRTIGLGKKLIQDTLNLVGTHVEMVAVIAKYNPFAEKAGMQKITEQQPTKSVLAISCSPFCFGSAKTFPQNQKLAQKDVSKV